MKAPLFHLAQRVFNVPLAITSDKAEVILAAMGQRFAGAPVILNGRLLGTGAAMMADDDYEGGGEERPDPGYDVIAGVAVIPVCGTLVHKLGGVRPYSGMSGYDSIRTAFLTALTDERIDAVVLDIDSPGGEVSGCFDLADTIFAARGHKPIWAILSEHAFSAAFALASACDRIVVPRTGGAGSVGVIFMHAEFSEWLKHEGIAVTLMTFGAQKADLNQVMPIDPGARARAQAIINETGELFIDTVARNRKLAASAVRATKAGIFIGKAAVGAGFADAVMAPDAAMRALVRSLDHKP
ncbi:MAG: S49 family peptidase [Xanthomonadaceae bacterium]|nr:S49 family peptidase [Xanthomonadaceae bacterium]